jgi:hypothetical protein
MLIPILLACIAYAVYFVKKTKARSKFVETREKFQKDKFIVTKRTFEWIYNNFVFSFTLSLLFISLFSMLSYELSIIPAKSQYSDFFIEASYGLFTFIIILIGIIYCSEIISGVQRYIELRDSKDNVKDDNKNIDHDSNSEHNFYHPLYVPVYLIYQLFLFASLSLLFIKFNYLI